MGWLSSAMSQVTGLSGEAIWSASVGVSPPGPVPVGESAHACKSALRAGTEIPSRAALRNSARLSNAGAGDCCMTPPQIGLARPGSPWHELNTQSITARKSAGVVTCDASP